MEPYFESDDRRRLYEGDCREVLSEFDPNTFDAVVTDPPYELGFMGQDWDGSGVAFDPETWRAVLRVLKPGGYLLAFSSTRTYHRLAIAIEDAGFEIHNQIYWLYGGGFPKGLDLSKQADKDVGAEEEREVVDEYELPDHKGDNYNQGHRDYESFTYQRTAPATDEAKRLEGLKSGIQCLKPAAEPVCVAMAPLSEDTYLANHRRWGTGAMNVKGARIPTDEEWEGSEREGEVDEGNTYKSEQLNSRSSSAHPGGRYPTNVILDERVARTLDAQVGHLGKSTGTHHAGTSFLGEIELSEARGQVGYFDRGGPSRFYYCAKASPGERELPGGDKNDHPTLKPVDLIRYLVDLVTHREDQTVLDPFAGSGTTVVAAGIVGRGAVGIDISRDYLEIARQRLRQGHLF